MKYFPARVAWLPALPVRLAARFQLADRQPFADERPVAYSANCDLSQPLVTTLRPNGRRQCFAGSVCRNVKLVGMADSCRHSWGRHEFRRWESSMW